MIYSTGTDGLISSSSSSSASRKIGSSMTLRRRRQLGIPTTETAQLVVMPLKTTVVELTVTVDVMVFGVTRKRRMLGTWRLAGSSDCPTLETSTEAEANTAQDRRTTTRTDDCILCAVRFSISSQLRQLALVNTLCLYIPTEM